MMKCAECFLPIEKGQRYFVRPSGKRAHRVCQKGNDKVAQWLRDIEADYSGPIVPKDVQANCWATLSPRLLAIIADQRQHIVELETQAKEKP